MSPYTIKRPLFLRKKFAAFVLEKYYTPLLLLALKVKKQKYGVASYETIRKNHRCLLKVPFNQIVSIVYKKAWRRIFLYRSLSSVPRNQQSHDHR